MVGKTGISNRVANLGATFFFNKEGLSQSLTPTLISILKVFIEGKGKKSK